MKRRGLTLVETMVSLSLFCLVVILVFNLFPGAVISLRKGELRSRADRIAQTTLNQARDRAFSALVVGSTASYSQDYDDTTFQWQVAVKPVPDTDQDRLKVVQVSVEWKERSETKRAVHEVWVANVSR